MTKYLEMEADFVLLNIITEKGKYQRALSQLTTDVKMYFSMEQLS